MCMLTLIVISPISQPVATPTFATAAAAALASTLAAADHSLDRLGNKYLNG